VHKADFERLLATRSRGRSAHFAVHHVNEAPAPVAPHRGQPRTAELSTADARIMTLPVDNQPVAHWLGCMVPKRQARRAVTRNLVRRQMRESFRRHAAALPMGLWLLRLHAGFPKADFPSARSPALAEAVRCELERLLTNAARPR
jgi:ribonuclease P protein component